MDTGDKNSENPFTAKRFIVILDRDTAGAEREIVMEEDRR